MSGEDKIREEIRRRILEKMQAKEADANRLKTFKLSGNEAADQRLESATIQPGEAKTPSAAE